MTACAHGPLNVALHGLVKIAIAPGNPFLPDLVEGLGDVPALPATGYHAPQDAARIPEVRLQYAPKLDCGLLHDLGRGLLCDRSTLLDRTYGMRLSVPTEGVVRLETSGVGWEWLMWAIQLTLLKARVAFVHAAGLEKDGHALLVASGGGAGKTALVAGLMRQEGWRLLGDDLIILSPEGRCYGFPKPMAIYPYHRPLYPEVFACGSRPLAPAVWLGPLKRAGRRLEPLLRANPRILQSARRCNPGCRCTSPSRVFGADRLAATAGLRTVVWLDRVPGMSSIRLEPGDDTLPSRLLGSTLREFDARCVAATSAAFSLGILSAADVYVAWDGIVRRGVRSADSWMLHAPSHMGVAELAPAVVREFKAAGIID